MSKKLIDSNIIVYAYDNSDPGKHLIAKEIVTELEENNEGVLSVQNLAEFAKALSEKAEPPRPYQEVRTYVLQLENVYRVVGYHPDTVAEALHIASNYGVHFYDALLAATMEENFISEIITEDEKDFGRIPWLKVINPFKNEKK